MGIICLVLVILCKNKLLRFMSFSDYSFCMFVRPCGLLVSLTYDITVTV